MEYPNRYALKVIIVHKALWLKYLVLQDILVIRVLQTIQLNVCKDIIVPEEHMYKIQEINKLEVVSVLLVTIVSKVVHIQHHVQLDISLHKKVDLNFLNVSNVQMVLCA
jgi:hypothetical protein